MAWRALVVKITSLAVTTFLLALALLSASLWRARVALPYNDLGRFYDSAKGVVFKDSAVTFYGMLALVFGAMALASALLTVRLWRRRRS
jgi:hypothetical protein